MLHADLWLRLRAGRTGPPNPQRENMGKTPGKPRASWTWDKPLVQCQAGHGLKPASMATGPEFGGAKEEQPKKNTSQVFTSSCRSAAPPVECSAGPLPPPRAARWSRSPAHGRDPRTNARGSVRSGRGWTVDQMLVWSKVSRNSKGKKPNTTCLGLPELPRNSCGSLCLSQTGRV